MLSVPAPTVPAATFSPLVLADRLITLAQEADRAGFCASASRLIGAAFAVLDEEKASASNWATANSAKLAPEPGDRRPA